MFEFNYYFIKLYCVSNANINIIMMHLTDNEIRNDAIIDYKKYFNTTHWKLSHANY